MKLDDYYHENFSEDDLNDLTKHDIIRYVIENYDPEDVLAHWPLDEIKGFVKNNEDNDLILNGDARYRSRRPHLREGEVYSSLLGGNLKDNDLEAAIKVAFEKHGVKLIDILYTL